MKISRSHIILCMILLIALVFRVWSIGSESYWLDESISIKQAEQEYSASMQMVKSDVHMPLYNIVLHYWIKVFGISEISSRSLSCIFGLLSVILIYILSRKLFSEETSLFAAMLMAVSPISIYYSQEARLYSLFIFITLASYYFFIKYLEPKRRGMYLAFYALSSILMIYTHIFGFLVLLSQNIYVLYKSRLDKNKISNLGKWAICQAIIVASFIPWLPTFITQANFTNLGWISPPNVWVVLDTFVKYFGNVLNLIIFVALLSYIIYAIIYKKSNVLREDNNLLLASWIIVPFAAVIIYSIIFSPLYNSRYLLFTLPALLILLCTLIEKSSKGKKYLKYSLMSVLIISCIISSAVQAIRADKDDWRTAAAYVGETIRNDEILFIDPLYHQDPFTYYYDEECFRHSEINDVYTCNFKSNNIVSVNWKEDCCNDETKLTAIDGQDILKEYENKKIFLISLKPELAYDNNQSAYKYFSSRKNLTFTKEFGNIKIYRFE